MKNGKKSEIRKVRDREKSEVEKRWEKIEMRMSKMEKVRVGESRRKGVVKDGKIQKSEKIQRSEKN